MCLASGCTPVKDYTRDTALSVRVEADDQVRSALGDVEVTVESRTASANSWTLVTSQRFTPSSEEADWPLAFRIDSYDSAATYLVTATSRDEAGGGVVIQARALTALNLSPPRKVLLRLDAKCLRRTMLCGRTQTCSVGECVDAREPQLESADPSKTKSAAADSNLRADAAAACTEEDARSCDSASDTLPLVCKGGSWQADAECAGNMRCQQGRCVASGTQCATLGVGARFCDVSGLIYQCQDTTTAMPSPCDDKERCIDMGGDAYCDCQPGLVRDNQVCTEPVDCRDQGGCDPSTRCQMENGKRVCTPCPPGYAGTGETGCRPLAVGLTISPGTLQPTFDPNTLLYAATVPFATPRVGVTVDFDVPAHLTINEQPALAGVAWPSPVLTGDQTQLAVALRTASAVHTDYQLLIERAKPKQTYLKASNGKMGDQFGGFLDAYGDTLVVGAPYETRSSKDPEGSSSAILNAGAAYVFVRDANGSWRQQDYLKADTIQEQDYFGLSVALWKDRIAVGAPGDVVSSIIPGAANGKVHVFVRNGDKWLHERTINSANNVANGDAFGFRVAMRENTLWVGAPLDDNGATRSGAVYVYEWDGSDWRNVQRLKAMPPVAEARFGSSVEPGDEVAMVGSFQEDHGGLTRPGAAYAYRRDAQKWSLLQRLVSPMPRDMAHFGATLAVDGNTVVVTAPHNPLETTPTHAGEAYVYEVTSTELVLKQMLAADAPAAGDQFASSVALRNGLLLLSAPYEKTTATPHGAAYLFAQTPKGFARSATMAPATIDEDDFYGYDVALTADRAVVAAPSDDSGGHKVNADASDNSIQNSGAVYIFE